MTYCYRFLIITLLVTPLVGNDRNHGSLSVTELIHLSREKVGQHDLNGALNLAQSALTRDPAFGQAWKQQGRVEMLLGNLEQALESLETADRLLEGDPQVQVWMLRVLMQQQRFDKLIERMEGLPKTAGELLDDIFIKEVLSGLLARSERRLAERICRNWEALSPQENSRRAAAALRMVLRGELGAAESTLSNAARVREAERSLVAFAWSQIGLGHLRSQRKEAAAAALERSLGMLPDDLTAIRELGWAYRSLGRPDEAAATWQKGVTRSAQAATWWAWIAEARLETGDFGAALQAVDRSLSAAPQQERARALKLMLLLLKTDEKGAQQYERQLDLQADGQEVKALGHALTQRHHGNFEAAATLLEKLLASRPNQELKNLLVDCYAGWAAQAGVGEAGEPLQRLVALEPSRPGAWRDLGWSRWSKGDHLEAIKAWNSAFSNGIDNHNELAEQLIGLIAEAKCAVSTADLYRTWRPGNSLADLGLKFFNEGRREAARQILSEAWDLSENLPVTGLHLAYLEARSGRCEEIPTRLLPFLQAHLHDMAPGQMELAIETLGRCRASAALVVSEKIQGRFHGGEGLFLPRLAKILWEEGEARRTVNDRADMLLYYAAASELDAGQLPWSHLVSFHDARETREDVRAFLVRTADRSSSPAVREGIRGWLEFSRGNAAGAISHYQASLESKPHQPEVRLALLRLLVDHDRFDEARSASHWFKDQLREGRSSLSSYLAEAHTLLGETTEARELWMQLHLSYPDSPHYAREYARQLAKDCRHQEAVEIVQSGLAYHQDRRAFELLAEIEAEQGRSVRVLEWTEQGLALGNSRGLLRMRVEAAEAMGQHQTVIEAGQELAAMDGGGPAIVSALLRALSASGRLEEAERLASDSLKADPTFLQGLLQLRDLALLKGDIRRRIELEGEILSQRPWDTDAKRRQALASAEAGDFDSAMRVLKPLAGSSPLQATPVLVYQRVTPCNCPGRNTTSQLTRHLERLAGMGYRLVAPADIKARKQNRRVLLIVLDPEPEALPEIDRVLKKIGGQAVLALSARSQRAGIPGVVPSELLSSLQSAGRWTVASRGSFISDPTGFLVEETREPMPLPSRFVPASWNQEELTRHLARNPLVLAQLDLAKSLSWSRQFERADHWFRSALEAGADPAEVYFHWGVNAYHQGDLASALRRLRRASDLSPDARKIQSALNRAENRKDFTLTLNGRDWEDSDDRRAVTYGAEFGGYLHDRLRLGFFADRNRWEREDWPGERGTRSGGSLLTHLGAGWRLRAEAWSLNFDDSGNRFGWRGNLHLPLRAWSGWLELDAERDEIGTLEALQEGVRASRYGVTGYSRLATSWELAISPSFIDRTDRNATRMLEGRLVYRAKEWPFLGIGYAFRMADSDRNPVEYWAPVELQQHQLYLAMRGEAGRFRYSVIGRGGYANQQGTDWRFTWGIRPQIGLRLTQRLSVTGEFIRLDTPVYRGETWLVGLSQRF
jgi:Tfp pilus assembly protein PilF/lipopolysaccharide biosynthesis regulator YciM